MSITKKVIMVLLAIPFFSIIAILIWWFIWGRAWMEGLWRRMIHDTRMPSRV